MLDISDIKKTIKELENSETKFDNCIKLAALYTVLDHYSPEESSKVAKTKTEDSGVQKEYTDILPMYHNYCDIKRKYQRDGVSSVAVMKSIKDVCTEIREFIQTLYSTTDMPEEREAIRYMLSELQNI